MSPTINLEGKIVRIPCFLGKLSHEHNLTVKMYIIERLSKIPVPLLNHRPDLWELESQTCGVRIILLQENHCQLRRSQGCQRFRRLKHCMLYAL